MTIVTAYFKIPSKAPHEFYMAHAARLLKTVRAPIVFCTTPDLRDEFQRIRGPLPIRFITYESVRDLEAFNNFDPKFWEGQKVMDHNPSRSPELYAIWYNKKEFVKRAMEVADGPYIWCDAGCARSDAWLPWLGTFGNAVKVPGGRLMLQLLNPLPSSGYIREGFVGVAGAIIAGDKDAWIRASEHYDIMIKEYATAAIPVCDDQHIWGSCAIRWPDNFLTIKPIHSPDEWFFFLKMMG
jgi:hypothetical protein